MNNADIFKQVFGIYATELWAMREKDYLKWLNSEHVAQPESEERKAEYAQNVPKEDLISRKAAIDVINELHDKPNAWLDLAVDALEKLPSAQPEIRTQMSSANLISRQETIDAVEILLEQTEEDADVKTWNNAIRGAINSIKHHVPPAQPEIIRCKDCKHHWTHRCMDSMPTEICELDQTFYDANVDFCSLAERRTDGCN